MSFSLLQVRDCYLVVILPKKYQLKTFLIERLQNLHSVYVIDCDFVLILFIIITIIHFLLQ
jgi:hypothetical protein